MSNQNCCCKRDCTAAAIVVSIIVGIIGAALSFIGTVTITPAFYWVTFGIAVVSLAVALLAAVLAGRNGRGCICSGLTALLAGILGTAFLSLLLLGTAVVTTTPLGAVLNGLLLGFLFLILTSFACLVRCAANCSSCDIG